MTKEEARQNTQPAVSTTTPRPLDATQLEQVVGGLSASAGGSKWGPRGGKNWGGGASAG